MTSPSETDLRVAIVHLRVAVIQLLEAIHRAGGWNVFDPLHQDSIHAAMTTLEIALLETWPEDGA